MEHDVPRGNAPVVITAGDLLAAAITVSLPGARHPGPWMPEGLCEARRGTDGLFMERNRMIWMKRWNYAAVPQRNTVRIFAEMPVAASCVFYSPARQQDFTVLHLAQGTHLPVPLSPCGQTDR